MSEHTHLPPIDPALAASVDSTVAGSAAAPIGTVEPRTRWAGIIWGIVLATIAIGGAFYTLSNNVDFGFTSWVMTLTPFTLAIYFILGIAAIAVIGVLVALLRHAQKTLAARRARI